MFRTEDLATFRDDFSGALDSFGFPPCPGNVMVSNPVWSQSVAASSASSNPGCSSRDPDAAMNIAIFSDAAAVTGRSELLARAKRSLVELLRGENALLARFAT